MTEQIYTVHTDGGSRGNPGPAAIGVILSGPKIGKKEYGESIGQTTNNVAEYQAVLFALKKLKQLVGTKDCGDAVVEVFADSELVVKQLTGHYKIKEPDLQDIFMEIWNLRLDFGKVSFFHVPREENQQADRMVNYALDREENKLNI